MGSDPDPAVPSAEDQPRLSSARILLRALDHRSQLAGLELREARTRLVFFVVLAVAAGALLQLALLAGFAAIVAATWDTAWRVWAPLLSATALAGMGTLLLLMLRRRMRGWAPFGDTLDQLSKDARSLHRLLNPTPPSR